MPLFRPLSRACLLLLSILVATPDVGAQQAPASGPRTRLTCENFRGNRLSFVDNPMAAAGINRRLLGADDAISARLEIVYPNQGADASLHAQIGGPSGGKPVAAQLRRYQAGEYVGFFGFDAEDASTHVVTYFPRINKAMWTIHSDRLEGRDRAASARSYFADCRRDELR